MIWMKQRRGGSLPSLNQLPTLMVRGNDDALFCIVLPFLLREGWTKSVACEKSYGEHYCNVKLGVFLTFTCKDWIWCSRLEIDKCFWGVNAAEEVAFEDIWWLGNAALEESHLFVSICDND